MACTSRSDRYLTRKQRRFECLESRNMLSITVDTLVDEMDGSVVDGDISLRDAINAASAGEVIDFAPALDGGTITLTLGELFINKSLTIDASALASGPTIDASGNDPTPMEDCGNGSRVINIVPPAQTNVVVELIGLTLTGGDSNGRGGAISVAAGSIVFDVHLIVRGCTITDNSSTHTFGGGAISTFSSLSVIDSVITSNSAVTGGGINGRLGKTERMLIQDSVISGNEAVGRGGGLYAYTIDHSPTAPMVEIQRSTISGNSAGQDGGGIAAHLYETDNSLKVNASTISGNEAGTRGGGIYATSSASGLGFVLSNSTVSGNSSITAGGGIYLANFHDFANLDAALEHNTITQNIAPVGAGLHIKSNRVSATLKHSIVSANKDASEMPSNIGGADVNLANSSFNFVGTGGNGGLVHSNQGNIVGNDDPRLGPLQNNGGLTLTHNPLNALSPVVDSGDPAALAGIGGIPEFDQRGAPFGRVVDGDGDMTARIDIGAVEFQEAFLLGDYNRNGVVDAADYVIWRKMFGTTGIPPFSGADGNGDGMIDEEDYNVWRANFGNTGGAGASQQAVAIDVASTSLTDAKASSTHVQASTIDKVDGATLTESELPFTSFSPVTRFTREVTPSSFIQNESRTHVKRIDSAVDDTSLLQILSERRVREYNRYAETGIELSDAHSREYDLISILENGLAADPFFQDLGADLDIPSALMPLQH